jgi:hypothetical protein
MLFYLVLIHNFEAYYTFKRAERAISAEHMRLSEVLAKSEFGDFSQENSR